MHIHARMHTRRCRPAPPCKHTHTRSKNTSAKANLCTPYKHIKISSTQQHANLNTHSPPSYTYKNTHHHQHSTSVHTHNLSYTHPHQHFHNDTLYPTNPNPNSYTSTPLPTHTHTTTHTATFIGNWSLLSLGGTHGCRHQQWEWPCWGDPVTPLPVACGNIPAVSTLTLKTCTQNHPRVLKSKVPCPPTPPRDTMNPFPSISPPPSCD